MKTRDVKTSYPKTISMSQKEADAVQTGQLKFNEVFSIRTGCSLGKANMKVVRKSLRYIFEKETKRRYAVARFKKEKHERV